MSLSEQGDVSLECLSDLTRHQKAVNIVRWSPDGSLLASGDDESVIIVWHLKPGDCGGGGLFDDDHDNKENWVVYKMIRSHLDDVYDLSWSGCGQFLLSGSVDNAAIITNVHKNNKVKLNNNTTDVNVALNSLFIISRLLTSQIVVDISRESVGTRSTA